MLSGHTLRLDGGFFMTADKCWPEIDRDRLPLTGSGDGHPAWQCQNSRVPFVGVLCQHGVGIPQKAVVQRV